MIVPLVGADIESKVIATIVNEVEQRQQLTGERTLGNLRETEEIKGELGVNLPDYPDRDAMKFGLWACLIVTGSAEQTRGYAEHAE